MSSGEVSVIVNGREYVDYKSLTYTRSLDNLSGNFQINTAFSWSEEKEPWRLLTYDLIIIKFLGVTVATCSIDQTKASFDKDSRTLDITGRDITSKLIDSSPSSELNGVYTSMRQLASRLRLEKDLGVFSLFLTDDPFEARELKINAGESYFDVISKQANRLGLRLTTNEVGALVVTDTVENQNFKRSITEGDNLLKATASFDGRNRYNSYNILSQTGFAGSNAGSSSKGNAIDDGVPPSRRFVHISDTPSGVADCIQIARWERNVRSAKSEQLTVEVIGWEVGFEKGGFWAPNQLVDVDIPSLDLGGKYVVIDMTLNSSESGETTTLKLEREGARQKDPRKQSDETFLWSEIES